jgi:hypothetical protein
VTTLPIPDGLRNLGASHYKNIFDIWPDNDRIYGTETLCGDWSAEILILAQDFASVDCLVDRIQENPNVNPYYHDPANETNVRLVQLLHENGVEVNIDGKDNLSCGVLYGSACWLIKEDGGLGGRLKNCAEMIRESSKVFKYTLWELRNLRYIICLGKFSYDFVHRNFFGKKGTWREAVIKREPLCVPEKKIVVYASSHTSLRGINNRRTKVNFKNKWSTVQEDWKHIFRSINSG